MSWQTALFAPNPLWLIVGIVIGCGLREWHSRIQDRRRRK